ncbi:MAG: flavodoxin [Oscillospiraceae bacterium]
MGKKTAAFFTAILMIFTLASCADSNQAQPDSSEVQEQPTSSLVEESSSESEAEVSEEEVPEESSQEDISAEGASTLVVFFSRHGNTMDGVDAVSSATLSSNDVTILSDMIVAATGEADLYQIITVEAYPTEYDAATETAQAEKNEEARPELANSVENMEQYDTIYLGYPIWWGTIPMPVATFLESYDFSGKTIIPFCTHEGSGLGSSEADIAELVPGATVLEGFAVSGNQADSARDGIEEWMESLNLVS